MSNQKSKLYIIYLITFVLAGCSLLYELLIAHTISILAANTVIWYSMTVGLFLGSLGFGSIIYKKFVKDDEYWSALFWVEVLLSVFGFLAPVLIHFGHIIHGQQIANLTAAATEAPSGFIFFAIAIIMIVIVGFLTGMELPLLFDAANNLAENKKVTNRVLAVDYLGSLFAGLIFPLVLVANFEVITIGLITALCNFFVAILILIRRAKQMSLFSWRIAATLVVAVIMTIGFVKLEAIHQYFLQKYYYYYESAVDENGPYASMKKTLPRIDRYSSPYQKIDIVEAPSLDLTDVVIDAYSTKYTDDPNWPYGYYLFLNQDFQLSSSVEEVYHEYFAHIPVMMQGQIPKNILVLGGGDGLLIKQLLKYDEVESLKQIDLDAMLINLAKKNKILSYMNDGSLKDERVETIIGDGLQYLRNTDEQFDAIYIDFPYAVDYNLSKLYSAEFFHFVHERMQDDGYAVFDATGAGLFTFFDDSSEEQQISADSEWFYYYHTLTEAGFETVVPYVSNLETDNDEAVKILQDMNLFEDETEPDPLLEVNEKTEAELSAYKEEQIQLMIQEFVWGLQQGFIMMKKGEKGPRELDIQYHEVDIPLQVLNEDRFKLAFSLPFPFPEFDVSKVNSIERPTLPNLPFWFIRMPY